MTLTLFKITEGRESKNLCANYRTKFSIDFRLDAIWCIVETSWSEEFPPHFILFHQWSTENHTKGNSLKTIFNVGLYLDIYVPISFKFDVITETTTLRFETSIDDIDLLNVIRNQKRLCPLSRSDLDEIQYVTTTCCFIDPHAKFSSHYQYWRGRTLLSWFHEIYTFNIGLRQDACEPICFKLCVITTRQNSTILLHF